MVMLFTFKSNQTLQESKMIELFQVAGLRP